MRGVSPWPFESRLLSSRTCAIHPFAASVRICGTPPVRYLIVKVMLLDVSLSVPPPYSPPGVPGLVTVTDTLPAVAMAEAGIAAVSCFPLTKVVAGLVPPQFTTALDAKLAPFTASVKLEPPAVALFGANCAIAGTTAG